MIAEQTRTIVFQGIAYNAEHGSPFDRGSADSHYSRPQDPHWYPEGSYRGNRIEATDMTLQEMREYYRGYEYNEQFGDKKSWD
jgi:hypothetical protein